MTFNLSELHFTSEYITVGKRCDSYHALESRVAKRTSDDARIDSGDHSAMSAMISLEHQERADR